MYEKYKICQELRSEEKCFRVQLYEEGNIIDVFHEHVPSHRISMNSEIEVLRTLVGKYGKWNGLFILQSRLNNRRGGPPLYPDFTIQVAYPEKGVIRRYVGFGNVTAWSDSVISSNEFRCEEKRNVSN